MAKLNQIVAVVKGQTTRTMTAVNAIDNNLPKPQLFTGLTKVYQPKEEEGQTFPTETLLVQKHAEQELKDVGALLTELYDVALTRDVGNTEAFASVTVEGLTLMKLPIPFLLFLGKQLADMRVRITRLPVRDPAERWTVPDGQVEAETAPVETFKTKKVLKVLEKSPATDKFPAQTETYSDDVIVGTWKTTKYSGAVSQARKNTLLARVDALIDAVKVATEEANQQEVTPMRLGKNLFDWLLAP